MSCEKKKTIQKNYAKKENIVFSGNAALMKKIIQPFSVWGFQH